MSDIRLSFENGEVYEITVVDAARVLAASAYEEHTEKYTQEVEFYEENPTEAKWDLPNCVGWDDIEEYVVQIEHEDTDYDDLLMSAELAVVENDS